MRNIKINKIIPLVFIIGVLTLSGCENKEVIQKDVLMTEEGTIKNESSEYMSEEQAKEIAKNSFKKYFNVEVDTENLFEHIELLKKGDENNNIAGENWEIAWSTFDRDRLKDTSKLTEDEKNKLYTDYEISKSYYIEIEGKSGNIKNIHIDEPKEEDTSLEEAEDIKFNDDYIKNIALDYIKKNKLVENVEDLKFFSDVSTDPNGSIPTFIYGENLAIIIWIEYTSKKARVVGFTYQDEQFVKELREDSKDFINQTVR